MIDKISDVRIRETVMEETTQAPEPQAQDNVAAEVEPLVQATPEYKSGLVAEQRLGGQAQEMLLANQLNSQIPSQDSNKAAVQNDVRTPTFTRDPAPPMKSVPEFVGDTLKQVPDQLGRTLGAIAEAWSDPGAVISDAAAEAKRKWDDIKAGK
jgi:hypothetical protein